MRDIVKRLRDAAEYDVGFGPLLREAAEAAEEIERLRKEVAKLQKLTGWQPIETYRKGVVMLYHPEETGRNALSPWIRAGTPSQTPFRKPTHWFPIPKPPAVDSEPQP